MKPFLFLLLISGTAVGEGLKATVVVEYKEKVGFDNLSKTDEWIPREKEFETRLNAMAWIKERKQQAINGEDYPIKDIKIFRVTKEEIR